jgi:predicted methyltransferase
VNDENFFPATIMPDADWWHTLWSDPESVLRALDIAPGMDIVDLCCGDGHFTAPLCRLVNPGQVSALDLDADLLAAAEQACQGQTNFHPILADANDLPNRIETPVDQVLMANTFHGVPDQTTLSRAVYDSLKAGGHFAIINWYRQPRENTTVLGQPRGPNTELRMQPDDVIAVVEPAGFDLDQVIDVGPYHYAAVFVKTNSL